jgi:RNA polymerase sigma-70 factor (ECF subfamily)
MKEARSELASDDSIRLVSPRGQALQSEFERRLADSSTLAFRVAYGVLRNREDAEDVAQEALVKAYRKFESLRDRMRFRAWLVRIAWRLALDRQRANRRRERREQAVVEPESALSVEGAAAAKEFQEHVWRAIDDLPEALRVVVVLAAINGHDLSEVGALLGVPEGTVKSRLHRARKGLAERLRWIASGQKP